MKDDKKFCPLIDNEINGYECMENVDVVDGLIKESSLPDRYKTKDGWKDICIQCKWHDY